MLAQCGMRIHARNASAHPSANVQSRRLAFSFVFDYKLGFVECSRKIILLFDFAHLNGIDATNESEVSGKKYKKNLCQFHRRPSGHNRLIFVSQES